MVELKSSSLNWRAGSPYFVPANAAGRLGANGEAVMVAVVEAVRPVVQSVAFTVTAPASR